MASSTPDYQPPLVMTLTAEMLEEDDGNTQEEFKTLSTSEPEGFSEVGNSVVLSLFNFFSLFILF